MLRRSGGSPASTPTSSVIEACDVVLLCTPPHFRPMHLQAAVDAGKHVFAEKPVAVDAPGVRSVLATCEEAKRKNLSVVSGLCLRYDNSLRETVKRIHDGAIGEIVAMQANDYRGPIWVQPRQTGLERHGLADAQLVLLHLAVAATSTSSSTSTSSTTCAWAIRTSTRYKAVGHRWPAGARRAGVRPHLRPFLRHVRVR